MRERPPLFPNPFVYGLAEFLMTEICSVLVERDECMCVCPVIDPQIGRRSLRLGVRVEPGFEIAWVLGRRLVIGKLSADPIGITPDIDPTARSVTVIEN